MGALLLKHFVKRVCAWYLGWTQIRTLDPCSKLKHFYQNPNCAIPCRRSLQLIRASLTTAVPRSLAHRPAAAADVSYGFQMERVGVRVRPSVVGAADHPLSPFAAVIFGEE